MYVAGFNLCKVLMEHFGHRAAGYVGAFLGQTAVGQIAASVFAVRHVDIADDVDDAAVGFFGQTFVLAAVAGFHVEDGNVQTLGTDDTEAGVGVAKNQYAVGLGLGEEFVGAIDDIATGGSEVIAYSIHIYFGFGELEVAEEDAVQVVVVVLAGVGENDVEVLTAFVDDCG